MGRSTLPPADPKGAILEGKYRLDAPIGHGHFGAVWSAVHVDLARPVAVKFLRRPSGASTEERVEQFLREARIAAAVRNRHVVDILDFGRSDVHGPFLVMELLEGESLAGRLSVQYPLPPGESVAIAEGILTGLAAIHRAGIVHRDVKPENVFLVDDPDGSFPKLLDFGVSRSLARESGLRSVIPTQTGAVAGTAQYMPPEQLRGQAVDWRADLYATGVVLFECLAGRLPFKASNMGDLVVEVLSGGAPDLEPLYPTLEPLAAIVGRALSHAPEDRYGSAIEMREALQAAARTLPEAAWEAEGGHGSEHSTQRSTGIPVSTGIRSSSPPASRPRGTVAAEDGTPPSDDPPPADGPPGDRLVAPPMHASGVPRSPPGPPGSPPGLEGPVETPEVQGYAKGTIIVGLRNYILERHGEAAWPELLNRLSEADRAVLGDLILVGGRYSVGAWNRALDTLLESYTDPDAAMREIAAYIAENDLTTLFKLILKMGSPQFLLKRTSSIWTRYFDTGRFSPSEVDAHTWHLELDAPTHEESAPTYYTCGPGVCAWLEKALRLTGVQAHIEHLECRLSRPGPCRYRVIWR